MVFFSVVNKNHLDSLHTEPGIHLLRKMVGRVHIKSHPYAHKILCSHLFSKVKQGLEDALVSELLFDIHRLDAVEEAALVEVHLVGNHHAADRSIRG